MSLCYCLVSFWHYTSGKTSLASNWVYSLPFWPKCDNEESESFIAGSRITLLLNAALFSHPNHTLMATGTISLSRLRFSASPALCFSSVLLPTRYCSKEHYVPNSWYYHTVTTLCWRTYIVAVEDYCHHDKQLRYIAVRCIFLFHLTFRETKLSCGLLLRQKEQSDERALYLLTSLIRCSSDFGQFVRQFLKVAWLAVD